ncbi:MAG: InlB B-repeat-containing protein, partial [Clostridia bacterium]|nr:InlB B-repeat-containing protein [Clostridia bacterium]
MSKAKKIVSLLLAVAMVLSIAPASVLSSAYLAPSYVHWGDTAGDAHGELEYSSTAPAVFYPDTSGTSPVIRVASGDNSYVLGNTVVKATPSGIPAFTGTTSNLNNAPRNGETPDYGYVRFKLYGAAPSAVPSITPDNNVTCVAYGTPTTTTTGGQTVYEAVWQIAGSTGNGVAPGTDITFTITYRVNGTQYETYAFTHVEYILLGSGINWSHHHLPTIGTKYRMSWVTQVLGKNVYNGGFNENGSNEGADWPRGYINWFSQATSGGALNGLGNEDAFADTAAAFAVAATYPQASTVKWQKETGLITGSKTNWRMGNVSGNRVRAVVYTDLGAPVSSSRLRDMNFRLLVLTGEASNFGGGQLNGFYPYQSYVNTSNETEPQSGTGTAASSSQWSYTASGSTSGLNTSGQYFNLLFTGTGPTSTGHTKWSFGIKFQANGTLKGGWFQTVEFEVYNKAQLKSFLASIAAGQAKAYNNTTYNVTGGYTKGAFPNANTYAGNSTNMALYNTFIAAFKAAAKIEQKPDTTQTEIDSAISTLATAYRALPDYVATHTVTVHHYQTGTTQQVANDTTYTVYHGDYVTAHCLKSVEGYDVVSTNTVQTGTIMGDTDFTFYYNPKSISLYAYTNDDDDDRRTIAVPFNSTYQIYTNPSDYTTTTINPGTKAHYTFAGWYTDSDLTQLLAVDNNGYYTMTSTQTVPIYGKWEITPIKISLDKTSAGAGVDTNFGSVTPNPSQTVYFQRPANDPVVSGYIFTGYFESDLTTPITFPIPFQFGDSDMTIYAKYRDVNGKIVFESNGGTQIADVTYNVGDSVNAPTPPTKVGYTFGGWYLDNGTFQQQIVWPQTMNSNTGFVAYAKWNPRQVKIVFNTNVGVRPTEYDTTSMPDFIGYAGDPIAAEDIADYNDPQRFGYRFDYWETPEGLPFTIDANATYPITDDLTGANGDEYVLTAQWVPEAYSAFLKLNGYEKLSGQYIETDTAQHGDIITVRMKTRTNFYIGSSAFVFMYDKSFFELVSNDGIIVNDANDYITGVGIDDSNAYTYNVAFDNNGTVFNWPTGCNAATYNAFLVTLDPDVLNGYTTAVKAEDDTWMIEFQLRVKDTASGTGKIYMDDAWSRTETNMMGTMFYGAATAANTPVYNTTNNVVTPNTNLATVLITIDETTPVDTTVYADPNGGTWSDNTTATKTFTGRAETEILGWADPVRVGYHLDDTSLTSAWVNTDAQSDATWVGGYYASEAANGKTFQANWIPNDYTVTFYWDTLDVAADPTVYQTFEQGYETVIAAPTAPTRTGYELDHWVDGNGNTVTFDANGPTVPVDGANYYAVWTPSLVNVTVRYQRSGGNGNLGTFQGYSDATVSIVETLPVPAAECTTSTQGTGSNTWTLYYHAASNTYYILDTESGLFRTVGLYAYDRSANTLPITDTIAPDGSTVLTVNYLGRPVTITWDANGGQFADTSTTKTENGRAGDMIGGPGESPTRYGYTLTQTSLEGQDFDLWMYSNAATSRWVPGDTTMTADRTYKAQWTAKEVTVHFVVKDPVTQSVSADNQVTTFDSQIVVPSSLESSLDVNGYDFLGWSTTENGTTAALGTVSHENDPTTNIAETYYAVFALHEYNIVYTLVYEGQSLQYATDSKTMGQAHTMEAAPEQVGYTFDGWYLVNSDNTETLYTGNAYVVGTADVNFKGYLNPKTITNTFDLNYTGSTALTADSTFNQAINVPDPDPVRAGYGFLGWATTNNATTGTWDLGTQTTETPATYYAVWEAHNLPYSVDIYLQNADDDGYTYDSSVTGLEGLVGSEVTYTLAPIANYTPTTATVSGTIPTDASTPLVLNAYYNRDTFTLTYLVDGASYAEQTYRHGATVTAPVNPTKTGYTFQSWSPAVPGTMPTENRTVNAVFTVNQYDVNFYKEATDTTAYFTLADRDYGSVITAPTAPSKTGYVFDGWYVKGDANQTLVTFNTTGPTVPAADIDYVAKWSVDTFKLQYVYGATVVEEFDVPYGTAAADMPVSELEPAHRAGWTFTGWDTDSLPATMPAQAVQIQALWTQNVYNVTYNAGAGQFADETTSHVLTHHYGDNPSDTGLNGVLYEEPTRVGYEFSDWTPALPGTVDEADITVTAVYTAKTYTITFNTDGGTAIEDIVADYDEEYTVPSNPVKVGYTFDHWENEDTGETFTFPADHKMDAYNDGEGDTLYLIAVYTINSHTLTLALDDGTYATAPTGYTAQANGTYTRTVDYGTVISAPTNPAKVGYTFQGWSPAFPITMQDADITTTAQWTVNQYTITFDTDGGSAINPITQDYNTAITAPANPTKTGYTFAGWTKNGAAATIPETMPAESYTLVATWTVNQYTITFDTDGGSTIAPITQDYDTAITAPANPTKTGYTFAGWTKNGAAATIPETMPAESYTLV